MKRALSHKEHLERLDSAVSLENITVVYGKETALSDITIDLQAGAITGIVGPNNSGKSTLIKTVLGIIKPVAGNIYIFSRPNKGLKNDVGYIPYHMKVNWTFPTNVFDMVLTGAYNRIKPAETPKLSDKEYATETLKRLDLYDLRKNGIYSLTIGERQRVLLARAVMQGPRIYLADEPILGSDKKSEEIIVKIMEELKLAGKTIVVAHRDILSIPKYFDKIMFLNGKVIDYGDCSEVLNEKNIEKTYGTSTNILKSITKGME